MALPSLPEPRANWSAWGSAVHDAVNGAAQVADVGTAGTATGDALRSAYVRTNSLVFNVRDFGAKGDGTTNDTAAVQAAINAAAVNQPNTQGLGGGCVFVPAGNYMVGQLRLKSRVTIEGVGRHSRFTLAAGTNTHMFVLDAQSVGEVAMRFLTLDGNRSQQTADSRGIFFDGSPSASIVHDANTLGQHDGNHRLLDIYVANFKGDGIYITGRGEHRLTDCYSWLNDGRGFFMSAPDSRLVACVAGDNGLQGFILSTANLQLVGCKAWFSGRIDPSNGDGFLIQGGRNALAGCEAQDNYGGGFAISGGNNNSLTGCTADSNNRLFATTGQTKAGFYLANARYNTITGTSLDRSVPGSPEQAHGLAFGAAGTVSENRIALTISGMRVAETSQVTTHDNIVRINARDDSIGFCPTLMGVATTPTLWAAANDARYLRVQSGGSINTVRIHVTTSAGNISVAAYRRSGSGVAAVPGTRLALSATVPCSAAGAADIPLGSTVLLEPGDFLALSCDSATAAFQGISGPASTIYAGQSYQANNQHPLPNPAASLTASQFRMPMLLGLLV